MKRQVDKKRRHFEFEIGDWVLIKLQTHRQITLACSLHNKLKQKNYETFQLSTKFQQLQYTQITKGWQNSPTYQSPR